MSTTLKLGDYNLLRAVRKADFGMYLDGGSEGDILLPTRYVPQGLKIGDEVDVFLYLDQEERLIATTERPKAKVGDFAWLQCTWVNQYGAFLDWGLMKDLFCPFREQKMKMVKGHSYLVHIHIDPESYRIMASAKVERYLNDEFPPYYPGDQVDLLVWQKTDLGFKVIVDNRYPALLYDNQVFRPLRSGDRAVGFIDQVREDGKIDVSLQAHGRQGTEDFAERLLQYLEDHDGYCPLGDKSDAQDIRDTFGVSKKMFKRAIGDLYKRRLIKLEEEGIMRNLPLPPSQGGGTRESER